MAMSNLSIKVELYISATDLKQLDLTSKVNQTALQTITVI
jgi:hypothetical protein